MAQLAFYPARYDLNSIDLTARGTAVVAIPEEEQKYTPAQILSLQGKTIEIMYYKNSDNISFYGGLGRYQWLWYSYQLTDISLPMPKELTEED